ncbi:ABC transporter ATP-binding protein [Kibdelosporangium aridum]|uniref:ABC transporter ATP-binding protein n=1 Tax=Kibdelosporangium aridum TaxID=2030 RepID=UPI000AD2469D
MTAILSIKDLRSGYGGGEVLHGVNLIVPAGRVLVLLGRNGVGKSTLVMTVMGLVRPAAGAVLFEGRQITGMRTDEIARAGIGLVPQGRRVFAPLTVEENLRIAARPGPWTVHRVFELLPRLRERRNNRGDQLSGGEQEMLAIGRALVGQPRLLLMDEPSDGLAPVIVTTVSGVIRDLCQTGVSVLLVEQNLHAALSVADKIAVMTAGEIALTTDPEDFLANPGRARSLLGVGQS